MEAVALLLKSDTGSEVQRFTEHVKYYAISGSRYLNRGTRGRLPIEEAFTEYLSYPNRSLVVDFRMHGGLLGPCRLAT